VEFTVDTATLISGGKMQSDCDDIRITDVNGNLLDYDYENCNNASTTIIFELSRIDAGMNAVAYFYYGKSTASQGNNKKTIASRIINGDFSSSDWTGWTSTPATDGGTTEFWIDDWPDDGDCVNPSGTSDGPCNYGAGRIEVLSSAEGDAVCAPGSGCPTPVVGDGASLTLGGSGSAYNGNIYSDSYEVPGGVYIHWWHNLQGRSSDAGRYSTATRWYGTPQAYTVTEGEGPAWALVKDGDRDNDIDESDEIISWDAWGAENGGVTTDKNEQKIIDVRSYSGEYVKVYIESTHGGGGDDSLIQIDYLYWADSAGNEIDLLSSTGSEEKSKGPVGYWSFDEGYGTTAQDGSQNDNDGTITGASWQTEDQCVVGKCLRFDGVDDYVKILSAAEFLPENDFTVSFWQKLNSRDSTVLMASDGSGNNEFLFYNDDNLLGDKFVSTVDAVSGTSDWVESDTDTELNKWTYMTVIREGTDLNFYRNGISDGGGFLDGTINPGISSPLFIGVDIDSGDEGAKGNWFNGNLDEIKIYNYARTEEEIKQDYNAGLAAMSTPKGSSVAIGSESPAWMSDGLVGYWKMDEASWNGTTGEVIDASGNGNHGTAVSTATVSSGKFGNGGNFDGTSDTYVSLPDNMTDLSGDWAVGGWIKPYNDSNPRVFTSITDNDNLEVGYMAGSLVPYIRIDDSVQSASASLSSGEWQYIIYQIKAGTREIYLNGELLSLGSGGISANGQYSALGGGYGNYQMNGSLDDFRFYNRSLSFDEIKELYEYAPGPVLHLKMDEKSGTMAYDTSGNGNNGAITAATWEKGKYGSSLNFSSTSNTNVRGTISPAIIASGDYTQEAWIYATANADGAIIDDYNNAEHYIMRNSTGTIKVNYYDNPGTPTHVFAQSTKTVPLNTWTHVAGVVESGDSI
jgi:hypothetical protein